MSLCMYERHRERDTHIHRCLKEILLSNKEKNRCDPWGITRESEKASHVKIRQEIFEEEEQYVKKSFWCI